MQGIRGAAQGLCENLKKSEEERRRQAKNARPALKGACANPRVRDEPSRSEVVQTAFDRRPHFVRADPGRASDDYALLFLPDRTPPLLRNGERGRNQLGSAVATRENTINADIHGPSLEQVGNDIHQVGCSQGEALLEDQTEPQTRDIAVLFPSAHHALGADHQEAMRGRILLQRHEALNGRGHISEPPVHSNGGATIVAIIDELWRSTRKMDKTRAQADARGVGHQ